MKFIASIILLASVSSHVYGEEGRIKRDDLATLQKRQSVSPPPNIPLMPTAVSSVFLGVFRLCMIVSPTLVNSVFSGQLSGLLQMKRL